MCRTRIPYKREKSIMHEQNNLKSTSGCTTGIWISQHPNSFPIGMSGMGELEAPLCVVATVANGPHWMTAMTMAELCWQSEHVPNCMGGELCPRDRNFSEWHVLKFVFRHPYIPVGTGASTFDANKINNWRLHKVQMRTYPASHEAQSICSESAVAYFHPCTCCWAQQIRSDCATVWYKRDTRDHANNIYKFKMWINTSSLHRKEDRIFIVRGYTTASKHDSFTSNSRCQASRDRNIHVNRCVSTLQMIHENACEHSSRLQLTLVYQLHIILF